MHPLTAPPSAQAQGTFLTQLRSPRWLKYPVHAAGSNKPWQAQLPLDALPDGESASRHARTRHAALRTSHTARSQDRPTAT
eukprot:4092989-Pleurochrysis_carterae.AAC.5